jgi:hypothetical protein
MRDLTPAEQHQLRFLRDQVDSKEREAFRTDMHQDLNADLRRARKELSDYVSELRENGRQI